MNQMSAEMGAGSERQKAISTNVSERVEALASVVDKVVCDTMHATKTASQALAVASGLSRVSDACALPSRDGGEMLLEAKFKAFESYCEEMISSQCSVQREQLLKVTHSMNDMGKEFMKNVDRFDAELADHRQQIENFCADTKLCLQGLPSENLRELSESMRTFDERTSVIESILKRMTVRIAAFDRIITKPEEISGADSRPLPFLAGKIGPISSEVIVRGSRVEAEYQDSWYNGTVVKLPEDDKVGRRYGVQCDVDDEGKLTYTSKVRLKDPGSSGADGIIDHSSSTCSSSTEVLGQSKRLDASQTIYESMAESRYDDVATTHSKESARVSSVPSTIVPPLPLSAALGRVPLDEKSIGHEESKLAAHEKIKPKTEVTSSQALRRASPLGRRKAEPKMRERPWSHSPVVDSLQGTQQPENPPGQAEAPPILSLAMAARGKCQNATSSACSTETASPPVSPLTQNLSPSEWAPEPMQTQSPTIAAAEHPHHLDSFVRERVAKQMSQIEERLDQEQPMPLGQPTSFAPSKEIGTKSRLQEPLPLAVVLEVPESDVAEVSLAQVDQLKPESPEVPRDLKAVADAKASAAVTKAVEDVMTSQLDQHQKELQSWWVERKEVAGRIAADLFGGSRGAVAESPRTASRDVASKIFNMAGTLDMEDQRRPTSALTENQPTSLSAIVSLPSRGLDTASDLPSTAHSTSTQVSMRVRSRSPGMENLGSQQGEGLQSVVLAKFIEPVPTYGGEQSAPACEHSLSSRTVMDRTSGLSVAQNKILERSGRPIIGSFSLPLLSHEPLDATRKTEVPTITSSEKRMPTQRRPSPAPSAPGMRESFAPPPQASVVPSFIDRRSPSPFRVDVPLASSTVMQRAQLAGASNVLNHSSPQRRLPQERIRTASPVNRR